MVLPKAAVLGGSSAAVLVAVAKHLHKLSPQLIYVPFDALLGLCLSALCEECRCRLSRSATESKVRRLQSAKSL